MHISDAGIKPEQWIRSTACVKKLYSFAPFSDAGANRMRLRCEGMDASLGELQR